MPTRPTGASSIEAGAWDAVLPIGNRRASEAVALRVGVEVVASTWAMRELVDGSSVTAFKQSSMVSGEPSTVKRSLVQAARAVAGIAIASAAARARRGASRRRCAERGNFTIPRQFDRRWSHPSH